MKYRISDDKFSEFCWIIQPDAASERCGVGWRWQTGDNFQSTPSSSSCFAHSFFPFFPSPTPRFVWKILLKITRGDGSEIIIMTERWEIKNLWAAAEKKTRQREHFNVEPASSSTNSRHFCGIFAEEFSTFHSSSLSPHFLFHLFIQFQFSLSRSFDVYPRHTAGIKCSRRECWMAFPSGWKQKVFHALIMMWFNYSTVKSERNCLLPASSVPFNGFRNAFR